MTSKIATREDVERIVCHADTFVIRRHGAFFRPDAAGSTPHVIAAGIYTKAEAEGYLHAEGVTIHPLEDYRAEVEAAAMQDRRVLDHLQGIQNRVDGP